MQQGEGDLVRAPKGINLKAVWKKNLEAKEENLKPGFLSLPADIAKFPGLSARSKIVYAAILSFIRKKGYGRCNPSLEAIAEVSGMSRWQVGRAIDELQDKFFVENLQTGRTIAYAIRPMPERDELAKKRHAEQQKFAKKFQPVDAPAADPDAAQAQ